MIEQRVTLRYDAQQIPAIVQAVQGDTGRDVIFELADYEIPAGATANYYIDKPDDTAIYNSAEVISSTEILAHLTEQALAAPGRNNGQVRILSNGEVITSFDFVLEVEVFRGLMRMQSETEVNIFDEALQAAAEDAIQEILDQTPVVTGMQNSIAPSYSSSSTYNIGDYVMYNARLYKCTTAISTAEAWTAAHWTAVGLGTDVNDLRCSLYSDIVILKDFKSSIFEMGGLLLGEDNTFRAQSRIRTPWLICPYYIYYDLSGTVSSARLTVQYGKDDGSYDSETGWTSTGAINPERRFRIMCTLDPSDETQRTVEEVFSAFEFKVQNEFDNYKLSDFEYGSINNGATDSYAHLFRIRNILMQEYDSDYLISNDDGSEFMVFLYDEDGNYTGNTGWFSNHRVYIVPHNTKFKLIMEKLGTTTYTPMAEILSYFHFAELPDEISKLINDGNISDIFVRGTFGANGLDASWYKKNRIATCRRLKSDRDICIYTKEGYISVWLLDENGNNMSVNPPWVSGNFYVPAGQWFALTVSKDTSYGPNVDVSFDDLMDIIDIRLANEYPYSINPNIVLQSRNVDETRIPPYSKWYIQAAAKNQYDRVRVNIRPTTDGRFVLIHNDTINDEARNADGSTISQAVSSSGQTFETLNSYDWGIKYGAAYAGYGVPTLEEAAKYAALYNLGLTIETSEGFPAASRESMIDEIAEILGKYGLLENLIVITATGSNWAEMEYWKTKSKYIGYYIGGEPADLMSDSWKTHIDSLITGYNTIWIQPFPWHTLPDQTLIDYCNENGYRLYSSVAMTMAELFDYLGVNHGATLIEANNVYMIKDTLMRHADELINE